MSTSSPTRVNTEYVRRHYSHGPTAYFEDGSIAKMPTAADVEYAGRQFDQWLAAHDADALATLPSPPADDVREAVRFLLHTGGVNVDGVQDADLLASELFSRFEVRLRGTVTEPCEWCPEQHTGFAEWHGDGLTHPSCGREGHGMNYEPANRSTT
uniref:hypothetical protein n=1 Tax=Microbacterium proteolyticum TaxID=1572644 RepID=UPI0024166927|nr:hypothetical protein [Microbacterium proteolyticum]